MNLKDDKQQNIQMTLDFSRTLTGESTFTDVSSQKSNPYSANIATDESRRTATKKGS
jgi:hypothetical protein